MKEIKEIMLILMKVELVLWYVMTLVSRVVDPGLHIIVYLAIHPFDMDIQDL